MISELFISLLAALFSLMPSYGSQGIQQLSPFRITGGTVQLASSTAGFSIPSLGTADCIGATDGILGSGTCTGGGGGSGFSTTSADFWLTVKDTDDLAEGTSQYFTNERAQDAVGGILVDSSTIDFTYNDAGAIIQAAVIGNHFSTTSADYWQTTKNFFSTTSADAWGATKAYSTFGYLFPSNATSTRLTFSGGLSTTYASTTGISGSFLCLSTDCRTAWPTFTDTSFSTTSADVWKDLRNFFSTTSTDYWGSTKGYATFGYLFPSNATSTQLNFSGGLQSFGSKIASTTAIVCKQSAACDYTTIQGAIDAGWTSIYVRNGVYAEQLNLANAKTQIVGESLNAIVQCNGSTQTPCITADVDEYRIANLTIRETNAALVGTAIDFSNAALGLIDGVRINNFATSTRAVDTASNTFYNRIQNSTFFNPRTCIELSGSQANANWSAWNRCRPMAVNGAFGIYLSDARGFSSTADDFEATSTSVTSTGIFVDATSREISFTNPWVEANGTGVRIASGANRVTFTGGSITSNGTDISDSGTNTVWINTSDTGVLVNQFGNATTTSLGILNLTASDCDVKSTTGGSLYCGTDATGSSSAFSTTSNDYWMTQRNFFSTTSADAWKTLSNFFSTTSADYWGSTKGYSTFATIKEGDSDAVLNATALDFGAGFDVTASPSTEGNVTLDLREYSGAASTTILSASTLCISSDCRTAWPSSGNTFGYPFPSDATSTPLSFSGGITTTNATSSNLYITELTASRPIFTDANKRLSSTGTVGAIEAAVGSQNILLETEIDGCSELIALIDDETGTCGGLVFSGGPTLTGTTTMTNASITGAVSLLGEYFTNFTNYVRSLFTGGTGINLSGGTLTFDCSEVEGTGINCSGESITLDATGDWTGTFDGVEGAAYGLAAGDTWTGNHDFGGASFLEIPNGTNPTANDPGEIAHDTSDNQLIVDDYVMGKAEERIWAVTIASTSPAFISAGLYPVPTHLDGYTITRIQCHVTSGTSKVIAVEDASANSSEDITCGTTNTTDDGSITNASYTASELSYIDFGSTSGSVDYVSISVFGTWTRE